MSAAGGDEAGPRPGEGDLLRVEDRGGVHVLTLAHGKANALDLELCVALEEALLASSTRASAIVLTGGGRMFSAGVDLDRLLGGGADYTGRFVPALMSALERLFFLPLPVVSAVNGHAIAGGCILACAADRRLCVRGGATLGVPELQVGVPFPTIGLEILRRIVPPQHLETVVYGGRAYAPEDALAVGLVEELVDADSLVDVAVQRARSLAELPPEAFALTKEQLRRPAREFLAEHRSSLDGRVAELWQSPASLERVRAFVDRTLRKRSPGAR